MERNTSRAPTPAQALAIVRVASVFAMQARNEAKDNEVRALDSEQQARKSQQEAERQTEQAQAARQLAEGRAEENRQLRYVADLQLASNLLKDDSSDAGSHIPVVFQEL